MLATLALTCASCSIAIRTPTRPDEAATCTRARTAPAVDTAAAVALALAGIAVIAAASDQGDEAKYIYLSSVPIWISSGLYGLSAHHGFRATRACRELGARPLSAR